MSFKSDHDICPATIESKNGYFVCACRYSKGHRGRHRCRYGQCVRQWSDRDAVTPSGASPGGTK